MLGGFVDYHIIRFIEGRFDTTELRKGHELAAVRSYARQLVESGSADRVEVRNSANNNLVFQYPRVLDRA
jgi:hypothetical protein